MFETHADVSATRNVPSRSRVRLPAAVLIALLSASPAFAADWKLTKGTNDDLPGQNVTVTRDGQIVARLIHGEGQQIPYLALYDTEGRLVTNAGLDKAGATVGSEPHHRGIFIGWQRVRSDLGVANLWSIGGGAKMTLVDLPELSTTSDSATIVARIEWRAPTADASGSNLLITETRRMRISRSAADDVATVDATFRLTPARDLTLDGDVQHAGIHLRVSHVVAENPKVTSYLWSPEVPGASGKVVSPQLKWGEFLFPLHGRWYSATQLNAPKNPVEEFSTREYGRFGFFFKKDLKKDEAFDVTYRFIVRNAETPAENPKRSAAETAAARAAAEAAYTAWVTQQQ
jgi:hypothetical protein